MARLFYLVSDLDTAATECRECPGLLTVEVALLAGEFSHFPFAQQ